MLELPNDARDGRSTGWFAMRSWRSFASSPGSGVPTERELCRLFGVSRATVRQALDCLEIEQRIYRQQGRGAFVAKPKIDQTLELSSHTENIHARAGWNRPRG